MSPKPVSGQPGKRDRLLDISAFPATNLCKLPQPTVVGYDGPEIMAAAPVFRLKESGLSDGG